jgi:hypothetical protein
VVTPNTGATIEIRLDSVTGTLLGTQDVPNTGAWSKSLRASCNLTSATGIHDLVLVFKGPAVFGFNLDWFYFLPFALPAAGPTAIHQRMQTAEAPDSDIRVFPNPANPYCYIDYRVPSGLAGKQALVRVLDIQGQSVWHGRFAAQGTRSRAFWAGVDNSGRAVSSGNYIIHVTLGEKTFKKAFSLVR